MFKVSPTGLANQVPAIVACPHSNSMLVPLRAPSFRLAHVADRSRNRCNPPNSLPQSLRTAIFLCRPFSFPPPSFHHSVYAVQPGRLPCRSTSVELGPGWQGACICWWLQH